MMFRGGNRPRPMNLDIAYFTIPRVASDDRLWRWYHAPGGRSVSLRPDRHGTTLAMLTVQQPPAGEDEWSGADCAGIGIDDGGAVAGRGARCRRVHARDKRARPTRAEEPITASQTECSRPGRVNGRTWMAAKQARMAAGFKHGHTPGGEHWALTDRLACADRLRSGRKPPTSTVSSSRSRVRPPRPSYISRRPDLF